MFGLRISAGGRNATGFDTLKLFASATEVGTREAAFPCPFVDQIEYPMIPGGGEWPEAARLSVGGDKPSGIHGAVSQLGTELPPEDLAEIVKPVEIPVLRHHPAVDPSAVQIARRCGCRVMVAVEVVISDMPVEQSRIREDDLLENPVGQVFRPPPQIGQLTLPVVRYLSLIHI